MTGAGVVGGDRPGTSAPGASWCSWAQLYGPRPFRLGLFERVRLLSEPVLGLVHQRIVGSGGFHPGRERGLVGLGRHSGGEEGIKTRKVVEEGGKEVVMTWTWRGKSPERRQRKLVVLLSYARKIALGVGERRRVRGKAPDIYAPLLGLFSRTSSLFYLESLP